MSLSDNFSFLTSSKGRTGGWSFESQSYHFTHLLWHTTSPEGHFVNLRRVLTLGLVIITELLKWPSGATKALAKPYLYNENAPASYQMFLMPARKYLAALKAAELQVSMAWSLCSPQLPHTEGNVKSEINAEKATPWKLIKCGCIQVNGHWQIYGKLASPRLPKIFHFLATTNTVPAQLKDKIRIGMQCCTSGIDNHLKRNNLGRKETI